MTDTITLPRAVIEQAIDTIGYYASVAGEDDQDTPAKQMQAALRAALAQQAEPAIKFRHGCQWCGKQNCTTHQQVAQQAEQVPATYQFRMKADWMNNWAEWVACNKEQHEMYLREPKLHDWNYETRALYAYPQVAQQAEQGWVSLNDGLPQPHQMVLVARGKFVTTGSYSPEFGWEWEQLDGEDDDSVATRWMPLPEFKETK